MYMYLRIYVSPKNRCARLFAMCGSVVYTFYCSVVLHNHSLWLKDIGMVVNKCEALISSKAEKIKHFIENPFT